VYRARHSSQCPVSREEWGLQRLRKSEIGGIISRQAVAHLPHAVEQDEMRITGKWKIDEIAESFGTPFSGDDGAAHVSPQDLRDFDVDKVRSMQRLIGGEDEWVDTPSCGRLQQNFKKRGSIDNDQRLFLSARTSAAGAGRGRTERRFESRFRISSRVGRSTAWRISRSRYSERDMPSSAARALSSRCKSEGTFRI